MNILFLSAWYPYPPNNGSKLRIYNLLRGLAELHTVTLVSLADPGQPELISTPPELKAICREVYAIPSRSYQAGSLRALLGFFASKPRVLVDRHVKAMADRVARELDSGQYDLVVASQWYTAAYVSEYMKSREIALPAIFEEAEIGLFVDRVMHAASLPKRLRYQLTNVKMQRYFNQLLPYFKAATVASSQERALLRQFASSSTAATVIPNGVRVDEYAPYLTQPKANTLIFTGSFRFFANYDSMLWFLQEVYPLILESIPGVRLTITGDHASLPLPSAKNVILTGYVKNVRPLVASSWASLAPIRSGGGTRLKILEAMALGTPVIATSKGAEGLDAWHEEHLLVADSPEAYARAAVRLLKDVSLRQRLAENALKLVREQYDWKVVMPRFLNLVDQAVNSDVSALSSVASAPLARPEGLER